VDSPNSKISSVPPSSRQHARRLRLHAESLPTPEGLGYLEEAIESKRRVRHRLVRDVGRLELATPGSLLMPIPAATPRADAATNALGELLLAEQRVEMPG
jgi:hypothetical protein